MKTGSSEGTCEASTCQPRIRRSSLSACSTQDDPYWKPFFDGFAPVRHWLAETKPDTVVLVYNDHGLNFFLDKMPTFAIGAAPTRRTIVVLEWERLS